MIEKQIEISQNDLFQFQKTSYKESNVLYCFVAISVFGVVMLIQTLIKGVRGNEFSSIILPTLFVLFPGLFYLFANYIAKKTKKETVGFNHPVTCRITDESFCSEGYMSNSTVLWKDMYNYMQDDTSFYLYISSLQAFVIPKRYFEKEEIDQINELLKTHVVKKKKGKKGIFLLVISIILIIASLLQLGALFF